MPILIFDIETVPDVASGRLLYKLHDLDDHDVAQAMQAMRRNKVGHDFLPHYLQQVVAISLVLATESNVKVWSLGTETSDEKDLITRFYSGVDKFTPTLVSWNGSGFDLPVLHYRALKHTIPAPTYWEMGENNQAFKWNNYISRFHFRHLDLMDVMAGYQMRAVAPLDDIASLCGFPGKMGMHGGKVWESYLAGDLQGIRNYCETDVLNTYGVYLHFECMRGNLNQQELQIKKEQLRAYLFEEQKPHLTDFAEALILD